MKDFELKLYSSDYECNEEAYKEFLELNDLSENDVNIEDWAEEENVDYFDDLLSNIKYSKYNYRRWAVIGTVGTWTGEHEIIPEIFDSLTEALVRCVYSNYDSTVEIFFNNEGMKIEKSHHDGTNVYQIRLLSKKGNDKYELDQYYNRDTILKERDMRKFSLTGKNSIDF